MQKSEETNLEPDFRYIRTEDERVNPVNIKSFKVKNKNARKRYEIHLRDSASIFNEKVMKTNEKVVNVANPEFQKCLF